MYVTTGEERLITKKVDMGVGGTLLVFLPRCLQN